MCIHCAITYGFVIAIDMPPKKKKGKKKGKKGKKDEAKEEDKYKKTLREIEILKDHLGMTWY